MLDFIRERFAIYFCSLGAGAGWTSLLLVDKVMLVLKLILLIMSLLLTFASLYLAWPKLAKAWRKRGLFDWTTLDDDDEE